MLRNSKANVCLATYHLLAGRCAALLYELRHGHSPGGAPKVAVIHLGRCEKLSANATRNLAKILNLEQNIWNMPNPAEVQLSNNIFRSSSRARMAWAELYNLLKINI